MSVSTMELMNSSDSLGGQLWAEESQQLDFAPWNTGVSDHSPFA